LQDKIIELEGEIQELSSRASKTNHQALQDKIKEYEQEVVLAKEEILTHNKQMQRFMEEGNRSIINQNEQISTCQDIISQIKEDMVFTFNDKLYRSSNSIY
jgi:acetyl-CoA carboxylase alpha subunit